MTKLTRSEQIVAEKTVCVLLVRGENPEGQKIYAYLAIRADRLQPFMEAQKSGTFYPEDYGIIIEAGEGEPSEEVRARMTQEYGFNHDAMLDLGGPTTAKSVTSGLADLAAGKDNKDQ